VIREYIFPDDVASMNGPKMPAVYSVFGIIAYYLIHIGTHHATDALEKQKRAVMRVMHHNNLTMHGTIKPIRPHIHHNALPGQE